MEPKSSLGRQVRERTAPFACFEEKDSRACCALGLGWFCTYASLLTPTGSCLQRRAAAFPSQGTGWFPSFPCVSPRLLSSPFPELLPWGTASLAASGSARPLSLCSIGQDVCPLLWWTAVYVEVWSDREFCLSWGPHYFSSVEGRIRKQRPRLADGLPACLFMSMDITCASAGLIFGLFFFPIWSLMCELMNFSMFRGGFLDVLTEVKVTRAVPNSTSPLIELKTLPFFFFSFEMSICTFRQYVQAVFWWFHGDIGYFLGSWSEMVFGGEPLFLIPQALSPCPSHTFYS